MTFVFTVVINPNPKIKRRFKNVCLKRVFKNVVIKSIVYSLFRLLKFVRFFLYFILLCATFRGEMKITTTLVSSRHHEHVRVLSINTLQQSNWADRERQSFRSPLIPISIFPAHRSSPAPRSTRAPPHFATPAHLSAPAHLIYDPLRSDFHWRSRSAHMLCAAAHRCCLMPIATGAVVCVSLC